MSCLKQQRVQIHFWFKHQQYEASKATFNNSYCTFFQWHQQDFCHWIKSKGWHNIRQYIMYCIFISQGQHFSWGSRNIWADWPQQHYHYFCSAHGISWYSFVSMRIFFKYIEGLTQSYPTPMENPSDLPKTGKGKRNKT